MKAKLSKKEHEELVTKGYLEMVLDERFAEQNLSLDHKFDKIDQRFEQIDQRFEQMDQRFDKIDQRFEEQNQRLEALMEHHMHNLQVFMEHMDDRYVLRKEWAGQSR